MLVSYPDSFRLEEGRILVESADCKIVKVFTQKYLNHSRYGLGAGKAEEIRDFVKGEEGIEQVVVDEHLTSKQLYNLSKLVGVQTIDRERLILDIFYSRATTTEAKLQIELAEIQYEMPRVREIAKMTSGNERPGKGGMGEYTVDVKFRDLKRRMNFIKEKLVEAKKKRDLYHQQRTKTQMPVVSLVGYTNSGKTTLFNLLTKEHKETSNSLFTTLSTTTRVLKFNEERQELLLTDTVGFISRLPPYMIDAFKSTLEESLAADLILLLLDSSEELENIEVKYSSCWDVLRELHVVSGKVIIVLTKHDAANAQKMYEIVQHLQLGDPLAISSKTGYGIHKLMNVMVKMSRQKMSA
ncbi:MAG: GTPase HflX [Thaumarchaeota archaeon 13_1_40CM_3_50_5]|nr:MAG: GTPase HflX [Thaumarchaeota archaeon 13_1_40CM_4_48_7]OLC25534.1 MAG: GTPase HflX [Candidatus Nitrososphaera sp. 13_1_40CM_48_12]OLC84359.1 MAG: GTPase HflX [Thaumarchaeota archaeon 13_1_40CM_3_50_5]